MEEERNNLFGIGLQFFAEDNTEEDAGEVGSEGNEGEANENGEQKHDDKGSKGASGKGGKTFTQEQVNRMMTREKNQGRNAVYKELGIDPKDSKTVAMFKAFIESQKTDEQKAQEQENENKAKVAEAENRAMIAEAKAEAMMLGVNTKFVEDIVTLAMGKVNESTDVKTAITELKTKYPNMFESNDDEEDDKGKAKGKTGQKGTGSSVKPSEKDKGGSEKGMGARLAAKRRSGSSKKSYWGNKS